MPPGEQGNGDEATRNSYGAGNPFQVIYHGSMSNNVNLLTASAWSWFSVCGNGRRILACARLHRTLGDPTIAFPTAGFPTDALLHVEDSYNRLHAVILIGMEDSSDVSDLTQLSN